MKINKSNIFIHPTSVVDDGAEIGIYTYIWHYCHLESKVKIGENCNLGQNVYVGNNSLIGNGCRIGNSVSIFGNIELEDFVFCAPFMVFTHISFPRAVVNRHLVFEKTIVRKGATLGANCTIVPGVQVNQGAFVAAGAVLTKSCKPWSLMVGAPARQVGWVSAFGDKIPLDLSGDGEWVCPHTGDLYKLVGEELCRYPGLLDILNYEHGKKHARIILNY